MKENKIKILHISVIVLGIIFMLIPAFHTNLWFDETYSVALSKHNFVDIWQIGSFDVHPILYYWVLKIINIVLGYNIIAYRLFSVVCLAILGILGYTHIRKDFGEKVGLFFSFLVLFLPVNLVYSAEIRMYTMAMLFVTVMGIYAYRITKNGSIKNWCIFGIFSLASAYTHYYGLATAGIVNVILFMYVIKNIIIDKKRGNISKPNRNNLISFGVTALAQILLYLPWLLAMAGQVGRVSNGFWIPSKNITEMAAELIQFQFTGNLGGTQYINETIAMTFAILFLIYAICVIVKEIKHKNTKEIKPALLAISVYFIVIAIITIISLKMPILYARYLLNMTGLAIFFLSFAMSKGNKYINIALCIAILAMNIYVNVNLAKVNYDETNMQPINYISENIQEGDMIIYDNKNSDFTGFMISVNFPEYNQIFYDVQDWNVADAYKAFGPNMTTIRDIDKILDYKGRIWVIECTDHNLLTEITEKLDNVHVEQQSDFTTAYKNSRYKISLVACG